MRQVNKPVEYWLYPDEGHRQWRPENKFHYYSQVEEFLAKHLGGRVEPAGDIAGHSAIAQ